MTHKTAKRKLRFLKAVQFGTHVSQAARLAGVDRSLPYKWAKLDPEFARAWDQALGDLAQARFTDAAFDAAMSGDVRSLMQLLHRLNHRPEARRSRAPVDIQIQVLSRNAPGSKPLITVNGRLLSSDHLTAD